MRPYFCFLNVLLHYYVQGSIMVTYLQINAFQLYYHVNKLSEVIIHFTSVYHIIIKCALNSNNQPSFETITDVYYCFHFMQYQ
jgi:NADH:ubiquinone oxidoreductase subunit C